jgi:thiol-disulfide isomerase/thioredoxin
MAYDFARHGIDVSDGMMWMDVNGDGRIDQTAGGAEMLRGHGAAPVFRVGESALQVTSVDLRRERFRVRLLPGTAVRRIAVEVGSVVPDFEFTDFAGVRRHLSDVKGRYVLLDFWATWCRPCVEDLPRQTRVYEELHGSGFEILGMNGDESYEKAEKMLKGMGAGWMEARRDTHLAEEEFGIVQWPTLILLDGQRRIMAVGSGPPLPLDGEHLGSSVRSLMEQKK